MSWVALVFLIPAAVLGVVFCYGLFQARRAMLPHVVDIWAMVVYTSLVAYVGYCVGVGVVLAFLTLAER